MRNLRLTGWLIAATAACAGASPPTDSVSYHRDIAPLLARHCVDCHEPGGAAPFSLRAYRDAAKRPRMLLHVVETGLMPPWKADPAYRSFANERRLSRAEIELLRRWVLAGAPAGDSARVGEAPKPAPPARDVPDLVLTMPRAFPIPADGRATYICVKIPYEIPRDTFVRAVDFVPGNRRRVHHASYQILEVAGDVDTRAGPSLQVYADSTGGATDDDRQFAYFKLVGRDGAPPRLVFHTGWLPGTSPQRFPAGTGFRLPKKGVLMIRSLHYSPTNASASDQSTVHLFFTDKPVERKVEFAAFKPEAALVPNRAPLFIPADTVMRFEIDNVVPLDVSILAINPHMHLLGKSFKVFAVTPAGDTVRLVHVPDWDFNWQEFYRFRHPVFLPKGSRLRAEAWYDNTRDNPVNPFQPPRRVFFERGMDDADEMMRLVIQYVPWRPGDEDITQEE
jgi:mono/diheme cytochrome c family protein